MTRKELGVDDGNLPAWGGGLRGVESKKRPCTDLGTLVRKWHEVNHS